MFVNFFLMFGSWRSLIRIQLEFKYLCWRNKEGVSKLTFACYLFLFRHELHGKHRFSLFFSVKSAKSVPKRNHQMYFDTLSFLFMKKTMCTLSDAYDKRTEEWKREVFRIRGSLGQERIPGKKGLQSRKMESKAMLPETAGNITEDKKEWKITSCFPGGYSGSVA